MAINRVIIEGNLTRDVEMRATTNGTVVAGFTVAVNEKRRNQQTGELDDAPVCWFLSVIVDQLEFSGSRPAKGDAAAPQEPEPAPAPDLYDEDIPF